MKILLVHNYYRLPGGEDTVYEQEVALLRSAGHEVVTYTRSNAESLEFSVWQKAMIPLRVTWAEDSRRQFLALLRDVRPDVVHFHNTHFMLSPAVYYACRKKGVPVVQSLDNPRLLCPAAVFVRNGRACEDCSGKAVPWPAVRHGCYRQSRVQSAMMAAMLTVHRALRTWHTTVDRFVVATEFYRRKFVAGGLAPEKLVIKPHFVAPDPCERRAGPGDYALYLGRLDTEKGVGTLLRAWEHLVIPLKIRGEGPLREDVQQAASRAPHIESVGRLSRDELFTLIKNARFLVWPSEGFYETFGMVAVEAFACGVPVVASRTGVAEEIVQNHHNGIYFEAGDSDDLKEKVNWAWQHPDEMVRLGRTARNTYEIKYTAETNLQRLLTIYQQVTRQQT